MEDIINTTIMTTASAIGDELINSIQNRERNINSIKLEMMKQWQLQGQELLQLQMERDCSQNALTELTGISKASVYNYIHIAKDIRFSELFKSDHHGGQLEHFNQKQLVKLTKLNDEDFNKSIEFGAILLPEKVETIKAIVMPTVTDKIAKEYSTSQLWVAKPVIQIDAKNRIIAQYPSAKAAQTVTGIDRMTIGKVCRGVGVSAGGYTWAFR